MEGKEGWEGSRWLRIALVWREEASTLFLGSRWQWWVGRSPGGGEEAAERCGAGKCLEIVVAGGSLVSLVVRREECSKGRLW